MTRSNESLSVRPTFLHRRALVIRDGDNTRLRPADNGR